MIVALIAIFAFGVTFALGYWLRWKGLHSTWALLAVPLLVVLLWGGGSLWIFSTKCRDIQVCDGGGFLAFSAGMAVALAIGVVSSILGLLLLRFVKP
jgi:hypothetical protein